MVNLTQDLGGNFTVRTDEGLFRIGSVDADALGLAPATAEARIVPQPLRRHH
jgi:hypothetical protein